MGNPGPRLANERCPICNSALTFLISHVDKYAYYYCKTCTGITSSPKPTYAELMVFYDGFFFGVQGSQVFQDQVEAIRQDTRRIVSDVKKLFGDVISARLLDWGGGTGVFANGFAEQGLDVTMMDIDSQACELARNCFGSRFRIINEDPTHSNLDETFDIIYCNQVVEHYADLDSFCQYLGRYLRDNGLLILTTPNQQCKEFFFRPHWLNAYLKMARPNRLLSLARFIRTPWICCDPPRHIHSFNATSIEHLLRRHAFEVITCFSEYVTSQYYSTGRLRRPDWTIRRPRSLLRIAAELYTHAGIRMLQMIDRKRRWGNNLVVYAARR